MKKIITFSLLYILLSGSASADLKSRISSLVTSSNTFQKGIQVVNLTSGDTVYDLHSDQLLKPASVLKIAVSSYLLNKLGPDYRFKTYLEASGRNGSKIKDLIIRGRGDPGFTTEDLWVLVRQLKKYGVTEIENLYLDDTAYVNPLPRSGQSAYQAGVSALPLNFNTITFKVCPSKLGQPAVVTWDPWEYPLDISGKVMTGRKTNYGIDDKTSADSAQRFLFRGEISYKAGCVDVHRTVSSPVQYFANTTYRFLDYLGIKLTGKLYREKYTKTANVLYTHESKSLAHILADLNKFSSNFIAQQLLYQSGEVNNRFDYQLGLQQIKKYLLSLGCNRQIVLADASGLSHENRITAEDLSRIVMTTYRNPKIWAEFVASLAVDGQVGTLRKRKYATGITLRGKTGTINGVDSLLAIVQSKSGRVYSFVSLHNKVTNAWKSQKFEDDLVKLLYQYG